MTAFVTGDHTVGGTRLVVLLRTRALAEVGQDSCTVGREALTERSGKGAVEAWVELALSPYALIAVTM